MPTRKVSPYLRRGMSIAALFIIGCVIASYGIVVMIKTDTIHAKTTELREKLKAQQAINERLAAKIKKRANLRAVDQYATEKLGMATPQTFQVIFLDSE